MIHEFLTTAISGAGAGVPASQVLIVTPFVAWSAIVGTLVFAAVALWVLRENPRGRQPEEPTMYRKAA